VPDFVSEVAFPAGKFSRCPAGNKISEGVTPISTRTEKIHVQTTSNFIRSARGVSRECITNHKKNEGIVLNSHAFFKRL
jgi:hypothetical protein